MILVLLAILFFSYCGRLLGAVQLQAADPAEAIAQEANCCGGNTATTAISFRCHPNADYIPADQEVSRGSGKDEMRDSAESARACDPERSFREFGNLRMPCGERGAVPRADLSCTARCIGFGAASDARSFDMFRDQLVEVVHQGCSKIGAPV